MNESKGRMGNTCEEGGGWLEKVVAKSKGETVQMRLRDGRRCRDDWERKN